MNRRTDVAASTPPAEHSRGLAFAPDSYIIPSRGQLLVLNRLGIFHLRSNGIDRLHRALEPYINGAHGEQDLVASVPENRRKTVADYLRKLREIGAVIVRSARSTSGAYVSLEGPVRFPPTRHTSYLFFVNVQQIRTILLARNSHGFARRSVTYVVDTRRLSGRDQDACKIAVASWLTNIQPRSWEGPWVRIYAMGDDGLTIREVFRIRGSKPSDRRAMADSLHLIEAADVDQVPLICFVARHSLFAEAICRFGLDALPLRKELIRTFAARNALVEYGPGQTVELEGRKGRRLQLPASEVARWPIAGSLLLLRAKALELRAQACLQPPDNASEIDLLTEGSSHPDLAYLRDILRLRIGRIEARYYSTDAGLHVYEAANRRGASLLRAKAERDLLLVIAWDIFYAGIVAAALPSTDDFDKFATAAQLRSEIYRVERYFRRSGELQEFVHTRIRALGVTAWIGAFHDK